MPRYRFHHVSIASDLGLPELPEDDRTGSPASAQVRIQGGDDSLLAALPVAAYEIRVDAEDQHRFLIPEGAVLSVSPDGEARYAMRPDCPVDLLRHVLVGQLLPNALALAPRAVVAVLHASVVRFGATAVAFLGEGGIGKSTLAAACHAAGRTVLCDDCAPVVAEEAGGRLLVRSGPGRMKLWPDTVAALGLEAQVVGAIHAGSPKRLLRLREPASDLTLPLACIYQLVPGPALAARALPPADAIARLYQQCFGHRRSSTAGRSQHFTQVGTVAVAQPVVELTVPRGFAELPAVIAFLTASHGA